MSSHRKLFLLILATMLFLASLPSAAGEIRPELFNARALALGGAVRAIPSTVMAARMNPAALSPIRGFYGGFSYEGQDRDVGGFDAVQVTLVDNATSNFAGAIQYTRSTSDYQLEDLGISIAGGKSNHFGATLRYIHGRDSNLDSWESALVGDLGFLAERHGGLKIAVTGHDLFADQLGFLSPRIALGLAYPIFPRWNLSTDFVRHTEESMSDGQDYHVGLEWTPSGSSFALRFGQMWEGLTDEDATSIGFGWKSEEGWVFGYAVQKVRQISGFDNLRHCFSVQAAM